MINKLKIPLFFFLVTAVFFWQFFIKGLIPIPGDLVIGAYYPWLNQKWGYSVGVLVKNPGDPDIVSQFYPWRKIVIDSIKSRQLPLWDRTYFLGVTLIGNPQSGIFNPLNLLFFITENFNLVWGIHIVIKFFISLLTMYLLLKAWKLTTMASTIGSIAYSFSGNIVTWGEYSNQGFVFALFPLIIYFVFKGTVLSKKYMLGIPPVVALMIFAGYPQLVYYVFGFSALYMVFLTIKDKKALKQKLVDFLIFVTSFILGFGIASIQIIPSFQTLAQSIRSIDKVAYIWSIDKMPIKSLITGLIPDFFGNPSTYNYWGVGVYSAFAFYTSLVVLTLSILSTPLLKKSINTKYLWFSLIFVLLLSLGTPLTSWLQSISFLGLKGSSAGRGLFIYGFAAAALGAYGFDNLTKLQKFHLRLCLILPLAIFNILLITLILKKLQIFGLETTHLKVALRNSIWPLLISIFTSVTIVLFRKKTKLVFTLLTLILFIDVYRFGYKYLPYTKNQLIFPSTPTTNFLQAQPKPFRIIIQRAELFPQNTWSPYGIESVSGYDILVPKDTAEFINYVNYNQKSSSYARYMDITNYESPLLNISDTKYVIILNKTGGSTPVLDPVRYKKVFTEGIVEIWQNTQNLGRFYIPESYLVVNNDKLYPSLLDKKTKLQSEVFLTENPGIANLGKCKVSLTSYKQNGEEFQANCGDDSLLVISEPYNSDWHAKIQGTDAKIYKANGRFMSVVIPKGESLIQLYFLPDSLKIGALLSALSISLYLAAAVFFKLSK